MDPMGYVESPRNPNHSLALGKNCGKIDYKLVKALELPGSGQMIKTNDTLVVVYIQYIYIYM